MKWPLLTVSLVASAALLAAVAHVAVSSQHGFALPLDEELIGCAAPAPCIHPPPPNGILTVSSPGEVVCVMGARMGSSPGAVLLEGETLQIRSWSETSACFTLSADALASGRVTLAHADGTRSNTLALSAPAVVLSWDVPDPLRPGDSIVVHGRNLEYTRPTTAHAITARADEDRLEFFLSRSGEFPLTLTGGLVGPTVRVEPELVRTCSAGPRTTCSLLVNHVGHATRIVSARIGAAAANVKSASGAYLELEWPEGLSPGKHPLLVTFVDGPDLVGEVELLPTDATTVVELSPFVGLLHPGPSRLSEVRGALPVPFLHHITGAGTVMYGHSGVALLETDPSHRPVAREGIEAVLVGRTASFEMYASRNPIVVADGNRFVLVSQAGLDDSDVIRAFEVHLDPSGAEIRPSRREFQLSAAYSVERIVAAGLVDDSLIVAIGHGSAGQKLRFVARDRESLAASTKTLSLDPALVAFATNGIYADFAGSWFSDTHLFLSTCAATHVPAGLAIVPLSLSAEEIAFGAPIELIDGTDEARNILACQGTKDGFYWIERDSEGDHLYFTNGSGAPSRVLSLPASIPGVGDRHDLPRAFPSDPQRWLAGILAFEVLDDGEVLLLMAPRGSSAPSVSVYAVQTATAAVDHLGDVPVKMRSVRGDLCVSPFTDNSLCNGVGLYGCNPLACDMNVPLLEAHPSILVHRGRVLRSADGARVHVLLENEHRGRPMHATHQRVELQHHYLKRPR